jgi:enamine deaminase RidA (YjgF/YER057c/UK114 family)
MSVAWRRVERGRMLYLSGAARDSRQVLERLDRLMLEAGIGKANLLTAAVTLADESLLGEHNAAWQDWVDPLNPPLHVYAFGHPDRPDARVEILLTAAR